MMELRSKRRYSQPSPYPISKRRRINVFRFQANIVAEIIKFLPPCGIVAFGLTCTAALRVLQHLPLYRDIDWLAWKTHPKILQMLRPIRVTIAAEQMDKCDMSNVKTITVVGQSANLRIPFPHLKSLSILSERTVSAIHMFKNFTGLEKLDITNDQPNEQWKESFGLLLENNCKSLRKLSFYGRHHHPCLDSFLIKCKSLESLNIFMSNNDVEEIKNTHALIKHTNLKSFTYRSDGVKLETLFSWLPESIEQVYIASDLGGKLEDFQKNLTCKLPNLKRIHFHAYWPTTFESIENFIQVMLPHAPGLQTIVYMSHKEEVYQTLDVKTKVQTRKKYNYWR